MQYICNDKKNKQDENNLLFTNHKFFEKYFFC